MRRGLKTALTVTTVAALLGAALPASTHAKPKRKPKTLTVEGSIVATGFVTHSNFIFQCPDLPATQGADAYVVQVPMEFGAKDSEVTVTATSVSVDPAIELSFYDYGCGQGDLYLNPPTTVPAGTGYIVVQDHFGGAVDFELTLTQR